MDTSADPARLRGCPPKLTPAEIDALVGLVMDNPHLSLEDTVAAFLVQRGVTLSTPAVRRYLPAAGFHFHRLLRGRDVQGTDLRRDGEAAAAAPAVWLTEGTILLGRLVAA